MKAIIFDDEISTETVAKLICEIEEKTKDDKNITIYFSTNGGSEPVGKILIDYINNSNLNIIFIGWWSINSIGFDIFFRLKCKRKLMGAHAVLHLGSRKVDTSEMTQKISYDKFLLEDLKKYNEEGIEFYKSLGITDKEIKVICSGEDIYLNTERLNKIFKEGLYENRQTKNRI